MGKVDVGASNASAAASRAGRRATDGIHSPPRKNPRRHLRDAPETADGVAEGCREAAPRRTNAFGTPPGRCRATSRGSRRRSRARAARVRPSDPRKKPVARHRPMFAVSGRCRPETREMGFGEQRRTRGCAEDVPCEEACFRTTLDYVLSRVPKRASVWLLHSFCCFAEPAQNWNSRVQSCFRMEISFEICEIHETLKIPFVSTSYNSRNSRVWRPGREMTVRDPEKTREIGAVWCRGGLRAFFTFCCTLFTFGTCIQLRKKTHVMSIQMPMGKYPLSRGLAREEVERQAPPFLSLAPGCLGRNAENCCVLSRLGGCGIPSGNAPARDSHARLGARVVLAHHGRASQRCGVGASAFPAPPRPPPPPDRCPPRSSPEVVFQTRFRANFPLAGD